MREGYLYGYKVVTSQTHTCVNKVNTMIDYGTKTEIALVEGVIGLKIIIIKKA